jgi:hypothetical protein
MAAEIGREEVRRLAERGARVVEVLPSESYERLHLPRATGVPLARRAAAELDRGEPWSGSKSPGSAGSIGTPPARPTGSPPGCRRGEGRRRASCRDLAERSVPTCRTSERVAEVRARLAGDGRRGRVVVNERREATDPAATTVRPSASPKEILELMGEAARS